MHDWNQGEQAGLVSIGSYRLYISTHGPARASLNTPVAILFSGVGGTTAVWPAVIRGLSQYIRVIAYDRSGIGQSEASPDHNPPTLETIASELRSLLNATDIHPPYITIGFSWGGMLSVHFASTLPSKDQVKGMIFVDSGAPPPRSVKPNQASEPEADPYKVMPWLHPSVGAVTANLPFLDLTCPQHLTSLTDSEYAEYKTISSMPAHQKAAEKEITALKESYAEFSQHDFFSPKSNITDQLLRPSTPVVTIHANPAHDFSVLYEEGVKQGNGTEAQRAEYRHLLSTWRADVRANQNQFLNLSSTTLSIDCSETCGHTVPLLEPERIVEALKWVLAHIKQA